MKPIQIGDAVGDYRVIGIAGSGGMGTVYKIEHVITRRIEAMKLLPPGASDDPEQVARFEREIQVQARLHHPNIVAVYNAVRNGDLIALVMEYVEGESLQRMLEAGPLPVETAVEFTCQVLSALGYAHDAGVIHRDVAPANIIVTGDGTIKLTDFGLARTAMDIRVSASGVPVGSPWYMSPEQVRGVGALDARTDLYAVGAVLHEMLTGAKLFEAVGAFAVMRAHVEAVPLAPSSRNPKVPAALDQIVRKAVAKVPAMRFQSASEFRLALQNAAAVMRAVVVPIMPQPIAPQRSTHEMNAQLPVALPPITHLPTTQLPRPIAPRRAWGAIVGEMTSRLRGYRPSRAAMVAWVMAGGLLAGLFATRLFPPAGRARGVERAPRGAAVSPIGAPRMEPVAAAPVEPAAPIVVPPTVVPLTPEVPAETVKPVARARRRTPLPALTMGRASRTDPRFAIRVTGGEREPAAVTPPPSAHFRPIAEAPEPSTPKVDMAGAHEAAMAAIGMDPESPIAPAAAAPERPQNGGNRFVKALGKVNPFRRRPKRYVVEGAKSSLKKD
jgi:serine/threonine-protein kinase